MTGQLYRHYKGTVYEIICEAHDSEAPDRELIVYRARMRKEVIGRDGLFEVIVPSSREIVSSGVPSPRDRTWVRPKAMFFEHVKHNGYSGPRFRPVLLKPTDICCCCSHTDKQHRHAFPCCECDEFQPEYEIVEAT